MSGTAPTVRVTLQLPREVYERVQRAASAEKRRIEDILTVLISEGTSAHTAVQERSERLSAQEVCRLEEIVKSVEAPRLEALYASGPNTLRDQIEASPEAEETIGMGVCAAAWLLQRLRLGESQLSDYALGFYAYVFEKLHFGPAAEFLARVLIDSPVEIPGVYGPHLAAHALKILAGQSDVDVTYFRYGTQARAAVLKGIIRDGNRPEQELRV